MISRLLGAVIGGGTFCRVLAALLSRIPKPTQDRAIETAVPLLMSMANDSEERRSRMFLRLEQAGFHVLPVHFYSPVPKVRELAGLSGERFHANFDRDAQLALLDELAAHTGDLRQVPETAGEGQVHWRNPAFCPMDATVYYSMIRHFRPARVIEVGSGYSTLFARLAGQESLTCIEPYPKPWLPGVPAELIVKRVQDVESDIYDTLVENDFLFIDSTHVAKAGSDVVHLILNVLPRLKPGVVVHFHDVFLPYDYPEHWIRDLHLFWNEQYSVGALLQGGGWTVLMATNWLVQTAYGEVASRFPWVADRSGCSLWLRKSG